VPVLDSGSAETCFVDRALTRDALFAGLDRLDNAASGTVGTEEVSACLRLDFGEGVAARHVIVAAQRLVKACSKECMRDGGCGTGGEALVFAGPGPDTVRLIGEIPLDATLADRSVPVPEGLTVRHVVVCRGKGSAAREDIGVDYVEICR
jgi:hypothetical protein